MTHISVSQRKHLIDIFRSKKNKDDSPGCCCNLPAVADLQGNKMESAENMESQLICFSLNEVNQPN